MICRKITHTVIGLMLGMWFIMSPASLFALEPGFKTYTDPAKRFCFDYPATMTVKAVSLNEVKVFHPRATLRITVFVEKRSPKGSARAQILLEVLKKKLKEEMQDTKILEESDSSNPKDAQGYVICYYKDKRGIGLVQLVHYYVAPDRLLQMVISDRPAGFKNLEKVIRTIHRSLKIVDPDLK